MPVDPEIRRLAADPEVIATVEVVDSFFESMAEQKDLHPDTAGFTREQIIEDSWRLLKVGALRLYDAEVDDDDDDDAPVQESRTPGEIARARRVGSKLFAVRQRLRRTARRRRS